MASLDINIRQANADFQSVKNNIIECGVKVIEGTPTAEYGGKVKEVFEKGKLAERNSFWDTNLQNGNRTNFDSAYSSGGWNKNNFFPNHDIRPSNAYNTAYRMFFQFGMNAPEALDMVELAETQSIEIDFSQVKEFNYTFASCGISRLGVIDMRNAVACNATFYQYGPYALQTIDKVISAETTPWLSNSFGQMYNLKEIRFEGTVAKSISFPQSTGLSVESVDNIIDVLADLTGGTAQTLTLSSNVKASLTTEQLTSIANKNWRLG